MARHNVRIGVIGGTGLEKIDGLEVIEKLYPVTPWGYPSSNIVITSHPKGVKIAFLARHGVGHTYNPSEVPSRANIAALKHLGVEAIVAFSAVGSLREEIRPCDFVLPNQIIDRTRGVRPSTFYEGGIAAHAPFADPFDAVLTEIVYAARGALTGGADMHRDRTLICIEGPAFSTRAESKLYRTWGGDIINMSVLPEAKLAREAEIAYLMVCMSTDYDCWRTDAEPVTVDAVVKNTKANTCNAANLLLALLPDLHAALCEGRLGYVKGTMRYSCITDRGSWNAQAVARLKYILPEYYGT